MSLPKITSPSTPMPNGATHYSAKDWYRAGGLEVWNGVGYHCWLSCNWAGEDPLNYIRPIESGVKIPADWEERLNLALVLETERAIKQRDAFLETGIVTAALGGSHDTCFAAIVRKFIEELE